MEHERTEAAASLANVLISRGYRDPIVIALPRGGVPIGALLAHALDAPLDLWLARDIPVPFHPHRILGGVAERGTTILDDAEREKLDEVMVREAVRRAQRQLAEDTARYRGNLGAPSVRDATAILVDEAIDSPWRVMAAARDLMKRGARKVVVATPILTPSAAVALQYDAADIATITMALDVAQIAAWRTSMPAVTDTELELACEYATFSMTAS